MKKIFFGVIAITVLQVTSAQVKEGKIIYEQKIDLHRRMQDEQMKAMVPQFRTSKFELNFADNQSIYKVQEEEPDITENTDHGGIVMKFGGANNEYYKNFTTQKQIEKRELAIRIILLKIQSIILTGSWQIQQKLFLVTLVKKQQAKQKEEAM